MLVVFYRRQLLQVYHSKVFKMTADIVSLCAVRPPPRKKKGYCTRQKKWVGIDLHEAMWLVTRQQIVCLVLPGV